MDHEQVKPEKKIFAEGIGDIVFVRSAKAKSISIQVKPFSPVKITVPRFASLHEAERFMRSKLDWIRKTTAKKNKAERDFTIFTHDTKFKTPGHELVLTPDQRKNINILVKDGIIHVKYPADADVKHPLIQQCIRKGIEEAWRIEANRYLPGRLKELAEKFGYKYRSVSVRNSKTRWGSCSAQNDITLSIHCIRLPQKLIDYIILHELVHTIHKDHSERYHRELERVLPDEKQLSRDVGKYHMKIY